MSVSEDGRPARAARNQSLFREINERVRDLNEGFSLVLPLGDWVCECADHLCAERIALSAAEYEGIRQNGARFVVAPGDAHVWPDVEHVMERTDRYWVVETIGEAAAESERVDPRLRGRPST
jgi:hypothetical protein